MLKEVLDLFESHRIAVKVTDHRFGGVSVEVEFNGDARANQIAAVKALAAYDEGVLCAPTAFGKTAVAARLIVLRRVNTLVLVHRRQLMDQWRERLALFLGLNVKDIGQMGGGKKTQTGRLDVAVIQSLIRKGEVKNIVAEYGQVIVDECHHVSAFVRASVEKGEGEVRCRIDSNASSQRWTPPNHPYAMRSYSLQREQQEAGFGLSSSIRGHSSINRIHSTSRME